MFRPLVAALLVCFVGYPLRGVELTFSLTSQKETSPGSGRFHRLSEPQTWSPKETAIILCDVWDSHHCHRAVLRVNELVPRMNDMVTLLRSQGVTVIHAPSDCMAHYESHPCRKRAMETASVATYPESITDWCKKIPSEEAGVYPIDQTNGGEDDDPDEHRLWIKELETQGRNPKTPWRAQHAGISINDKLDFVTDKGKEVWNILESKGIKNVLLAGVHTNMCVLGRPFGLRRMVQSGKRTALIADMTDTMYDPNCHPFVSHFTGTDLIIDHIEKFVCPTLTSEQILGGKAFRFAADKRPTIALLIAEDEYKTETTLPPWSLQELGKDFRLRWVYGSEKSNNSVPGISAIQEADLLLVSVRRRPLLKDDLRFVREYEASGKPMLGIRTASHAFSLRKGSTEEGVDSWPEFDNQAWGGNYTNHHANNLKCTVMAITGADTHPLRTSWGESPFVSNGSLYLVSPLQKGTQVLMTGSVPDKPQEPVAWTFERANGGRSFYTSLGHPDDFQDERFRKWLADAAKWLVR